MTHEVLDNGFQAPVRDPAASAHGWRHDPPLPEGVLLDGERHGYLPEEGAPQPCTRAQLVKRLRKEPWTPEVRRPASS